MTMQDPVLLLWLFRSEDKEMRGTGKAPADMLVMPGIVILFPNEVWSTRYKTRVLSLHYKTRVLTIKDKTRG